MRSLALLAVVTACYTNAAVSTEDNEHGLDAFKIWTAFPDGTAITASDQSNFFECAAATRTRIDPDTKSVTYDFYFPSNGESTTFHLKADDSPGSVTFTVGSDPTPYKAVFYYSDYKTCAVEHFDLNGGECMLWVRQDAEDSVLQSCIEHYEKACGVKIPKDGNIPCVD